MGRKLTNYDHYCHICGKRIGDGEDYYQCARGIVTCYECANECGECYECNGCKD